MMSSGGTPLGDVRSYKWIAVLVMLAFLILGARLWQLQVMQGDHYYRRTADNFVKEVELPATRGQIRDAQGRVLVDNRPSYHVYVTPRFLNENAVARLKKHLHLDEDQVAALKAKAGAKKGLDRYRQILAFEDITRDQLGAVESDLGELPGVSVTAAAHRHYPHGKSAAHVLGYMNQITAEELAQLRDQGYRNGDWVGRSGLERQWEPYLRGKAGFERVIVDAKGHVKTGIDAREIESLVEGQSRRDPEPGDNIVLTLDLDLQRSVEKALAEHHSAAAVVVEVETGRVLSIASYPSFDPNVLTGRLTRAENERLTNDPLRPLLDKVLRENYYPASTFKIVPALAGLEDHVVDEYDKIRCTGGIGRPGHTFRCMKSHGPVNLYSALVQSCNVYFYELGEKVTMDRMARMATDLGFGAPTGIGIAGEVAGFVPTQEYYKKNGGFRIGYTLNTAIGQGSTKVTVMQLALAYAALANDGHLYMPQLVDRIETPSGRVVQAFAPHLRRELPVKPENLDKVRRALCGVINDEKGTAHSAFDETMGIDICGKSGTAQVRKNRKGEAAGWDTGNDHAWFAGYAPAKKPKIAVAVLIEHGGLGGHVAGPTAVQIFRSYFDRQRQQAQIKPSDTVPTNTVVPRP